MKKILILLILMLSSLNLFAVDYSYVPFSSRILSMGNASVASAQQSDIFIANPSLFAFSKHYIRMPSVYFSLYNIKELSKPGGFLQILFENPFSTKEEQKEVSIALLESIKSGQGKLLSSGLSFSTATGSIGLFFDNAIDVHTIGDGYTAASLLLEANSVLSVAFSVPFFINDYKYSFGLGLNFHYNMITSTENGNTGYGIDQIINILNTDGKYSALLNSVPVLSGFSMPLNLGLTFEYNNTLRFGLSYMNLLDTLKMSEYPGLNQLYYSLTGSTLDDEIHQNFTQGDFFSFQNPASLNFGMYYQAENRGFTKIIRPAIAFDYVDIIGLFHEELTTESILKRTRLGFEVSLINFLNVRFGLNSGYFSAGVGLDFMLFRLDAIYAVTEYGENLGDKPIDQLSIKFTLGYDI